VGNVLLLYCPLSLVKSKKNLADIIHGQGMYPAIYKSPPESRAR